MAAGVYKLSLCLTAPLPLLRPHRRPLSLLRLLRHRHSPITLPPPPPLSAALHPHLRSIHNSFTKKSLFPPKSSQQFHSQTANSLGDNDPVGPASHPWPEWSQFIDSLFAGGGYEFDSEKGQSFGLVYEGLSDEFVRAASACLCFARDRPDVLGLISRREIEVLIENGTPFLFKNAIDTERRMRSFLANRGSNAVQSGFFSNCGKNFTDMKQVEDGTFQATVLYMDQSLLQFSLK